MITKPALLTAIVAMGCGILTGELALAQSYPIRPIRMIYPFPPGGPNEGVIRLVAERLSSVLGQPVVVENHPGGAGGTVGAKFVATAEPDGYTLLWSTPGPLVVASAVYKNLGFDPVKSFAPVATIFSTPIILVVNPAVPAKSMQELIAYAKANPGKINFASPGFGTLSHLLGEMLRMTSGTNIVHVPYKGAAQAVTDLLAGQVQMDLDPATLVLPHIEAGKLRALAVTDETRMTELPDVPTTTESGFPKLQSTFWSGVLAPAGTPASIVNKLNTAINEVLHSTGLKASLAQLSAKPKIGSPQDFVVFMAAETRKWAGVANSAGIKID